jgi:hypothetical protein
VGGESRKQSRGKMRTDMNHVPLFPVSVHRPDCLF